MSLSLPQTLQKLIAARGPISVATYMQQSLVHPTQGYYTTRDPLGAKGDFITSPEISQMFGELIGINIVTQWMASHQPQSIRLVELGPGRGTLMSDLLRACQTFKPFFKSISSIELVEASPPLRQQQKRQLSPLLAPSAQLNWFDALKEVPRDGTPTFVIAHEFFDALPIYQFEKFGDGRRWLERLIDFNKTTSKFEFVLREPPTAHLSAMLQAEPRFRNLPAGSSIEVCPEAWSVADQMAQLLRSNGGGALIVDYGPMATIPTNTFRAFKSHHQVDPLSVEPGSADLTADVDFRALQDVFARHKLTTMGPVTQANWLHRMGIGARATVLAEEKTQRNDEEGKKRIESAYKRLVDPAMMGKTYKFLGVSLGNPIEGFQ